MNEPIATRPDWQQRVIDEKAQNDERIAKLTAFLDTAQFKALPIDDQDLLALQLGHMHQVSIVLGKRIERF